MRDDIPEMDILPEEIRTRLDRLFERALALFPGTTLVSKPTDSDPDTYYDLLTPFGRRTSVGLTFALLYDPFEVGDRPQDAAFGICLTARYYPALLDLANPHGGYRSLDLNTLEPLKALILEVFPEMDACSFQLKTCFA
jgi:hypothetical protein